MIIQNTSMKIQEMCYILKDTFLSKQSLQFKTLPVLENGNTCVS